MHHRRDNDVAGNDGVRRSGMQRRPKSMSPAADHHRCCGKRSCCARQLSRIFQHVCKCTRRHVHSVCTTRPHTMLCALAAALRGGRAGRRRPTICLLRVLPHPLGAAATAALRLREEMWRVYTSHMHALYCQPVYRTMRGDRPTYIQISAKLPVITLAINFI